jgi:DNA repair protein RadC
MVHNHPSGNSEPSDQDLRVTREIIDAGDLLKIDVVDHIIIGSDEFYSIRNKRKTII